MTDDALPTNAGGVGLGDGTSAGDSDARAAAQSDGAGNPVETPEQAEARERAQAEADAKLVARARKFFQTASEAERDIRAAALEDIEFSIGEQWPTDVKQERSADRRPCLTINRIPQFLQQITNDQRQNRPSIKVHPADNGADVETAKVRQGLIRHIEENSHADIAYTRGFDAAARGSFGFWRVLTAYARPDSFNIEILIKSIRNPFSAFLDPNAQEPDGSDANEGGILEYLTREEFEAQYPGTDATSSDGWAAIEGLKEPLWMRDGAIAVGEYMWREWVPENVHLLATGETVRESKLADRQAFAASKGVDASIVKTRLSHFPKVRWIKFNGIEILERGDIPGIYIPLIPVYGAEVDANGKIHRAGIVRHAKDAQRQLNYMKSAETEAIALAPKAPYVGAEGQFEGHEAEWAEANRKNHAYLEYKPVTLAGQLAPPPQRNAVEPAVLAITNAARGAADDLKATTGIYDPSLGAGPPDTSGIAIQKRNIQAQTANYHLFDNLANSIRHTGRVVNEMIPEVYDTAQTARIIGEDGTQRLVRLNETYKDEKTGKEVIHDLDAGLYAVTIDVGPSFASKRQEAAASMMDLSRSVPQIGQGCADLIVQNMDWPGADAVAERLRKMLPPQLAGDGPAKDIPPQVQAALHQQSQVIDALTKQLREATNEIAMKRYELEHQERVALAKIQADIEINLLKEGNKSSIALLAHELDAIKHRLDLLNVSVPIGEDATDLSGPGAGNGAAGPSMPTGGPPPGTSMETQ